MSKVNFFKPEDFEGFGLLIGDRDGIAEFVNAKLKAELEQLLQENERLRRLLDER